MKKIVLIAIALITVGAFAQDKRQERSQRPEFTPEQIATLKSKRMVLDLNLDESQRQNVYDLTLDHAKQRMAQKEKIKTGQKKGKKLSSDERFQLQDDRLNKAIAHKNAMKGILNQVQFEKWEKSMKRKSMKQKRKGMLKRKRMHDKRRN